MVLCFGQQTCEDLIHEPVPQEGFIDKAPYPVKMGQDVVDDFRTWLQELIDSGPELSYKDDKKRKKIASHVYGKKTDYFMMS